MYKLGGAASKNKRNSFYCWQKGIKILFRFSYAWFCLSCSKRQPAIVCSALAVEKGRAQLTDKDSRFFEIKGAHTQEQEESHKNCWNFCLCIKSKFVENLRILETKQQIYKSSCFVEWKKLFSDRHCKKRIAHKESILKFWREREISFHVSLGWAGWGESQKTWRLRNLLIIFEIMNPSQWKMGNLIESS